MALMRPTDFHGAKAIDGYGPGFFRVAGELFHSAVVVEADRVIPWAGLADPAPLLDLAGRIDVLFLGLGGEIAHPPATLRAALDQAGIRVEAMASPAAARTFNVTLSEGRRVACALLPL